MRSSATPGVVTAIGPTILLRSGSYFDLLAPESSAFTIQDIAHGLAMTCRFAGQCARFYSVAEHSVYVSAIVPPEDAFAALLHDASEAFLGDVSKPLKTLLGDYQAIERRVQRAIADRFGAPLTVPTSVKRADLTMLVTEQRQLMENTDPWPLTRDIEPANFAIACLKPERAKELFLARFRVLRGEITT